MTKNQLKLLVKTTAGDTWDADLHEFFGNIYHSREWAETINDKYQRPLFFSWQTEDTRIGLAIGIERWAHYPLIGRRIKHLTLESYPALHDHSEESLHQVFTTLLQHARKNGYLSLTINSFLSDYDVDSIDVEGFAKKDRLEFAVDLGLSDEEIFKNLATRHKRKIKKARKHNLILHEAETIEAMQQFRKLQLNSRERRVKRGESIGMLDDAYYEKLARDYFDKKLGRIFLLTHGDEAISAAFVTLYAGKAYYTYGGSSDLGFKMDAPPLLFSKIFSRCRELGCHEFNMGGVPAEATDESEQSHGLYQFKAGFGGREILCRTFQANSLQPVLSTASKILSRLR